jgi:AraC-like DNA-binding protein
MRDECSFPQTPAVIPGATLLRIWRVEADRTYGPVKNWDQPGLVALRTTAGHGRMELRDGLALDLPADSLAVVEAARIHRYHTVGRRWTFWWFEVLWKGKVPFPLHEVMSVSAEQDEPGRLSACFEQLRNPEPLVRCRATATMMELLYRWTSQWLGRARPDSDRRRLVAAAIRRMRRDLPLPVSVARLAEEADVSERWFRRVFAEVAGRPPKAYYDALRLDLAAEMLRMGQASVTQIAEQLGFSSPFHFSKAFKARHGAPPSRYRPR